MGATKVRIVECACGCGETFNAFSTFDGRPYQRAQRMYVEASHRPRYERERPRREAVMDALAHTGGDKAKWHPRLYEVVDGEWLPLHSEAPVPDVAFWKKSTG